MTLDVSTQLQGLLQVQWFDFKKTAITQSESQLLIQTMTLCVVGGLWDSLSVAVYVMDSQGQFLILTLVPSCTLLSKVWDFKQLPL
jgi:hypothetical protein